MLLRRSSRYILVVTIIVSTLFFAPPSVRAYDAACPAVVDAADTFQHVPLEHATIQDAIDAAVAGDTVCVETNGAVYNETLTIVTPDVTLLGASNGNNIGPGAGAPTIQRNAGGAPVIAIGADGVTINGFVVTATTGGPGIWTDGAALNNVTVRNNEVTGIDGPGVGFPHDTGPVTDNYIIFNEIYGNDAQGIYMATPAGTCAGGVGSSLNMERNVIANNDLFNNNCNGAGCNAFSFNIQINCASGNNVVINNTIRDQANSTDFFEAGMYLFNTSGNFVTCNTIANNFERGMVLWHPGGAPPTPNLISYNSLVGNGPSAAIWSIEGDALANATNNWWGNNPPPAGNPNNPDNVTASPFLTDPAQITPACQPPRIAKAFSPAQVANGETTTLTFTITNTYLAAPLYGIEFSDQLPAGLTFTGTTGGTCGGTVDATGNGNTLLTLTGGAIAVPSGNCTVTAEVQGNVDGVYNNTSDPLNTANSGVTTSQATASLTVGNPPAPTAAPPPPTGGDFSLNDPAISKIGLLTPGQTGVQGEQLEWVVSVSNPNGSPLNNITVTDTLVDALSLDRVEAPGATVSIDGQTVSVTYATLAAEQTVIFSIFTTVREGAEVTNTACLAGSDLCATAQVTRALPATGESPWWRLLLLVLPIGMVGSMMVLWRRRTHDLLS